MTTLVLHLTNAGLAAVEAASGSAPTVIAGLGLTATAFTVAPTLTALPGEFKRIGAVAGTEAAPNVTHMTAYDTSSDVWNATGFGLFLSDGTLFAVFSSSTTVISKAAAAFALIAFDIAFDADLAASIAFGDPIFTSPPATTEIRGVVELATNAEAAAGTDNTRALTPAAAVAALMGWIEARDGTGSLLDADLLDGHDSSWFADIVARLGFTPLDVAAFSAANILTLLEGVDGAGTGLDADLLDGLHAAAFVLASDGSKHGSNSDGTWELRPNGVLEQWGTVIGSMGEGGYARTFPTPFPDATKINLQLTAINSSAYTGSSRDTWMQAGAITNPGDGTGTGFTAVVQSSELGAHVDGFHWRAVAGP